LRTYADRPGIGRVVDALGSRAMTTYLWHMPVIIVLAAGLLVLHASVQLPLPEPLSPGWWASRPLWLLAVAAAVLPVAATFGRFENGSRAPAFLGSSWRVRTRTSLAVVLGAGAVVLLLATGISVAAATVATGMLVAALNLAGAPATGSVSTLRSLFR
jgi:hypothetical protein